MGLLRLFGGASDALLRSRHGKHSHNKHHGKHHKKKHHHHKQRHGDRSLWIINATTIKDAPRFQHRGLLIDTGRHFLPLPIIKVHLLAVSIIDAFYSHSNLRPGC